MQPKRRRRTCTPSSIGCNSKKALILPMEILWCSEQTASIVWHMSSSFALMTALLIVALSPLTPLHAQSRVSGVVLDSLSGVVRPLGSAIVTMPGLQRWADADTLGRFTFHNVPAGRHAISVLHAALDSLDVALPPSFIDAPETGEVTTVLATPGVRSLHEAMCGATLRDGSGLLLGRVSLGDDTRSDSGSVKLSWTDMEIVQSKLVRVPLTTSIALQTGATFVACDVPIGQPIRVEAYTSAGSSSPVEISIADLAFRHLPIHVRQGQHRLTFSVMANTGVPIENADVSSSGAHEKTRSDAMGRATLMSTAGTQSITVLKVGYEAHMQLLDVARDTNVSVAMPRAAVALTTKRIVGQFDSSLPEGFDARRRAGFGVILGPDVIEQLGGIELGSLLSQARGVTLGGTITGRSMPFIRGFKAGRCIPNYFVDGSPFVVEAVVPTPGKSRTFADLDAAVPPESILAIEVYASPVGIPPEFDLSSSTGCGTILIWTKRR